ncbi:MAG: hypothetical protein C4296_11730 [Gemmataceae bacterium]
MASVPTRDYATTSAGPSAVRSGAYGMRKGLRAVLAGAAVVCAVALVYPPLYARYAWWQAQRAAESFAFDVARSWLDWCLKYWPQDGAVHFFYARVARRMGDHVTARKHLRWARRYGYRPERLDLEYKLLQVQGGASHFAGPVVAGLLPHFPNDEVEILEALAHGYIRDGFFPEAHHWATMWTERHPHMWQAWFVRGIVYERGLRFALAAEMYTKVLQLDPEQHDARLSLAELLTKAGRWSEAREQIEVYLQKRPHDASAWVTCARCCQALRDYDQALAILERVLQQKPDHAQALWLRGQIELDMGRPAQQALPWLEKALAADPNNMDILEMTARVVQELGRSAEAQKYLERKKAIEADRRRMEAILKELAEEVGGPAVSPARSAELRYEAGQILVRLGQDEQAYRWLARALQLRPDYEQAQKLFEEVKARLFGSGSNTVRPAP